MENLTKIEIEGLKTIRKLCEFGFDRGMDGYSFTEIVERMLDELEAAKANAVPEPSQEKTWDEIHLDPKERLYWSLRSTKKRKSDLNWHHASHQTCVGSTHGRKICEYLGVDPDAKDFVRSQELSHD